MTGGSQGGGGGSSVRVGCLLGWLGIAIGAIQNPPEAAYTLTLLPGPRIEVKLQVTGDSDGETDLAVQPHWGGVANDGGDVVDLQVTGSASSLTPDHPSPTRWVVKHAPSEPLVVSYSITVRDRGPAPRNNDYRTRLDPELFHLIGELGLLLPQHMESTTKRSMSIRFDGFDTQGWSIMSSFGSGAGPFTVNMSGQEFRHSLVLAGKIRTLTREINGKAIGLAIVGDDWGFTDDAFADLATRIITIERDFWPDHTDPWFLIALIPSPGAATERSFSFGGTGLTSCFSLYCNTGFSLDPGSQHADQVKILLAHEYFHTWNGGKIPSSDEEGTGYWFSEGFTDFYARRLLHQAGMISDEVYLQKLNHMLGEAATSPVRNAPASRIKSEFWTNRDVQRLPYHRGDQVALAVDERIRQVSEGKRSLDDLMRSLLARSLKGDAYSTDVVLRLIEDQTDPAFAAAIRSVVVDGTDVPLPPAITSPKATLAKGRQQGFDAGFDIDATRTSKILSGVVEGGPAHAAGLRDGQKMKALSISSGNATSPPFAKVTIDEDGKDRAISYDPLTPGREVPVYKAGSK
jgi:predicted metalloprotease with PDZ domain